MSNTICRIAGGSFGTAIGISGAPGGDKDEACAKAGINKVAAQLRPDESLRS
jgi:uncharacterized protein GlcG (DUF336 family)